MIFNGLSNTHYLIELPSISPSVSDEGAVSLVYLDGSKELIDFKARRMMTTKFTVVMMTETQFDDLFDYMVENTGKEIQVTQDPNELVFGPRFNSSNLTINIKEVRPKGLTEFNYGGTVGIGMPVGAFELEIEAVLIKNGNEDVKKDPDFDFLVEIETRTPSYDYVLESLPPSGGFQNGTTVAVVVPPQGDLKGYTIGYILENGVWEEICPFAKDELIWHDTALEWNTWVNDVLRASNLFGKTNRYLCYVAETNRFYFVQNDIDNSKNLDTNGGSILSQPCKIFEVPPSSETYFKLPEFKRFVANAEEALNFKGGKFYFSSFKDHLVSDIENHPSYLWYKNSPSSYKSGFIASEGISFSSENADLTNGPATQKLEGFSVKLDNSKRFHWETLGFNLIGAKVSLYVAKRQPNGKYRKYLVSSGYNKTNSIDFSNYDFSVEPELFMTGKTTVPVQSWSNYSERWLGEIPSSSELLPMTYGRHTHAQVVKVSSKDDQFDFSFGLNTSLEANRTSEFKVVGITAWGFENDDDIYQLAVVPVCDKSHVYEQLTNSGIQSYFSDVHTSENKFLHFSGTSTDASSIMYSFNDGTMVYWNLMYDGEGNPNVTTAEFYFYVRGSSLPFEAPNDAIGLGFTVRIKESVFAIDGTEVGSSGSPFVQVFKKVNNEYVAYPSILFKKTMYGHGLFRLNLYAENLKLTGPGEFEISDTVDVKSSLAPRASETGFTFQVGDKYYDSNGNLVDFNLDTPRGQSEAISLNNWVSNGWLTVTVPDFIHRACMVGAGKASMTGQNNIWSFPSDTLFTGMATQTTTTDNPNVNSTINSKANLHRYNLQTSGYNYSAKLKADNHSSLPLYNEAKDQKWTQDATQLVNGVMTAYVPVCYIKHAGLGVPQQIQDLGDEFVKDLMRELPYVQMKSASPRVLSNSVFNTDLYDDNYKYHSPLPGFSYSSVNFYLSFSQGNHINNLLPVDRPYTVGSTVKGFDERTLPGSSGAWASYYRMEILGKVARSGWWSPNAMFNNPLGYYNTHYGPDYKQVKREGVFFWTPQSIAFYGIENVNTDVLIPDSIGYYGNGWLGNDVFDYVNIPPNHGEWASIPNSASHLSANVDIEIRDESSIPWITWNKGFLTSYTEGYAPNNANYTFKNTWNMPREEVFAQSLKFITKPSSTLTNAMMGASVRTDTYGRATLQYQGTKGVLAEEEFCAILPFEFDPNKLKNLRGKSDVRVHTSFNSQFNFTDGAGTEYPTALFVQVFLTKKNSPVRYQVGNGYWIECLARKDQNHYPDNYAFKLKNTMRPIMDQGVPSSHFGKSMFVLSEAEQLVMPGVTGGHITVNNMPESEGGCHDFFSFGISSKIGTGGSEVLTELPLVIPYGYRHNTNGTWSISPMDSNYKKIYRGVFAGRELFDSIPDTMLEVRADGTCELEDYNGVIFVLKPLLSSLESNNRNRSLSSMNWMVSNDIVSGTPHGVALSYKDSASLDDEIFVSAVGRNATQGGFYPTVKETGYTIGIDAYQQVKPGKLAFFPPAKENGSVFDYSKSYNIGAVDFGTSYNSSDWKVRTQFIDGVEISSILDDSAKHSFSVIATDANQNLYYKPLNYNDILGSAICAKFDESNIIKSDSIKTNFRDADKIYRSFKFLLQDDQFVKVYLNQNGLSVEVETSFKSSLWEQGIGSLKPTLLKMFQFSKALWDVGADSTLEIELPWCYSDNADYGIKGLLSLVYRYCQFNCFNAWTIGFRTSMNYVVDPSSTLSGRPISIGDYVEVKTWFMSNNFSVRGFVRSIDRSFYDGTVGLEVFCPAPPEAYSAFYDPYWYGGVVGDDYDPNNYKYTGVINVYPFRNEEDARGTWATAPGNLDTSNPNLFTFTDNTFANGQWIL